MSEAPDEPQCGNCRFWMNNNERGHGDCRRYAPRPVVGRQAIEWGNVPGGPEDVDQEPWWPRTHFETWCGDYQPEPNP